ncbi:hypothetical protein [Methylobacterium hispanicum]
MTHQPYSPATEELPPETRTAEEILRDLVGQEAWDMIKPAEPASDEA